MPLLVLKINVLFWNPLKIKLLPLLPPVQIKDAIKIPKKYSIIGQFYSIKDYLLLLLLPLTHSLFKYTSLTKINKIEKKKSYLIFIGFLKVTTNLKKNMPREK